MTISVRPVNRSSRYQRLLVDLQDGQKTVLLDGPISTELDSRGVTMASGKERRVAKDDPESLVQVHVDYINAGARIITTNTFGRTRQVLGNDFEELTRAAVDCAFEARRRTGTEDSVVVAGSLAYHTAKGPGKYDPDQDPESWEDDLGDLVDLLKTVVSMSFCSRWSGDRLLPNPSFEQHRQAGCLSGLDSQYLGISKAAYMFSTTPRLPLMRLFQVSFSLQRKAQKEFSLMEETAGLTSLVPCTVNLLC